MTSFYTLKFGLHFKADISEKAAVNVIVGSVASKKAVERATQIWFRIFGLQI